MASQRAVFDLSPSEKLQLVEDLWDDLASAKDQVPVHEWQKAELDRRMKNLQETTAPLASWSEIKERVRSTRA